MFAKTIVLSDAFLDMPLTARCLYFTLGMFADDDGFVNAPRGIMRQCGASEDDMRMLLAKKFVLSFETGVIVIKHWRINNYLRADRYIPTKYTEELSRLGVDENGAYTSGIPSNGIPSIGKVSIGKNRINRERRFTPPTLDEVQAYCAERHSNVDPKQFFDYFTEGNWIDSAGKPVKNWKQKVISWEKRGTGPKISVPDYIEKQERGEYDKEEEHLW